MWSVFVTFCSSKQSVEEVKQLRITFFGEAIKTITKINHQTKLTREQ